MPLTGGNMAFSPRQEKHFRRYLAELGIKPDMWTAAVVLLGLASVMPRMQYTGPQDAFLMQAALLGSIFAAHTVPPLILLVKGREHYVQWRHVYLPALLAVDCVALFKMSCWGLMPEVRSGDTAKLAFMVYNMCTGHLVLLSLGRNLLFQHHLAVHGALLLAALRGQWRNCNQLRCKFQRDFATAADLLARLLLPPLAALDPRIGELLPSGTGVLGEDRGEEGCMEDCFVVHGMVVAVLGFLVPLIIVYKREQLLRRRFLAAEARREPQPQAPRLSPVGLVLAGNQLMVFALLSSALCWVVYRLAGGGMAAVLGTWDEMCPSAAH